MCFVQRKCINGEKGLCEDRGCQVPWEQTDALYQIDVWLMHGDHIGPESAHFHQNYLKQ